MELGILSTSLLKEPTSPPSSAWRGGLGQQRALKHKRKGKVLLDSLSGPLILFPEYVR